MPPVDLEMESNEDKATILMNAFYNEQDLGDILNYKDKIMAITTDDIKRVAKKYLSDNYLALYIEKGKPDKNAKIEKPGYKPVEPPIGKNRSMQHNSKPAHRTDGGEIRRLRRSANQATERPFKDVLHTQQGE